MVTSRSASGKSKELNRRDQSGATYSSLRSFGRLDDINLDVNGPDPGLAPSMTNYGIETEILRVDPHA